MASNGTSKAQLDISAIMGEQPSAFIPGKDFTQSTPQFCKPTEPVQGAQVVRTFLGRGVWFGQKADFWIFVHGSIVGLEINAENTYPTSHILLNKDKNNLVVGMSIQGMLPEKTFKEFCTWCLETYKKVDHSKIRREPARPDTGNMLDYAYWIRTNALIAKNEIVEYLTMASQTSAPNYDKLRRVIQNLEHVLEYNNKAIKKIEGEM